MGCFEFPTTQTWTTIMFCLCCCCCSITLMPQGSSAALQERLPIAAESANVIIPVTEGATMWIWAADLLHQGLFEKGSSTTASGAGFRIDIQANLTTVSTADCKLIQSNSTSKKKKIAAAMPTMEFTLDQFKLSPNLLQHRKRASVPIPVTCEDTFSSIPVHYGNAALGHSPSALPHQISASASLPLTFAYCLPPITTPGYGSLFFGVRPPSSSYPYNLPPLTRVPMSLSPSYSLLLTAVQMLNTPTQKLILGNGGLSVTLSSVLSYTFLPKTPYDYIYSSITKVLSQRRISEYKFSDPRYPSSGCYILNKADLLALPKIKLVFSGKYPLVLDAFNYFWLATDSIYCINILEGDEAIIGADAQQDRLVEFDLERKTFGFSEPLSKFNASCALKFSAT